VDGLAVEGLSAYPTGGDPHPPALVVAFGTPPAHAWAGALERLVAVLTPGACDRPPQESIGT